LPSIFVIRNIVALFQFAVYVELKIV